MEPRQLVTPANRLGFRLLEHVRRAAPGQNIFLSPLGLMGGLALLRNGAAGETAVLLEQLMDLEIPAPDDFNRAYALLWGGLENVDPAVTLHLAYGVWAAAQTPLQSEFARRAHAFFQAHADTLDFTDPEAAATAVNVWIATQTEGEIDQLLTAADLTAAESAVLLSNAFTFQGEWLAAFDPAQTEEGTFTPVDGEERPFPFMSRSGDYHYREVDAGQLLSLPFGLGQLSLIILLPPPGQSLAKTIAGLDAATWAGWLGNLIPFWGFPRETWDPRFNQMNQTPGEARLPRFSLDYRAELDAPLRAMGLGEGFTSRADFGRLVQGADTYLSQVWQRTRLTLDEAGTMATPETAASGPPDFQMDVNRPFFCAVQDNLTGLILGMGPVYDPAA
jgi:serpin B